MILVLGLELEIICGLHRAGNVNSDDCGYKENEDFYLTFVYRDYNEGITDSNYDEEMIDKKIDKVEYYINGKMYGYTYYGPDSYDKGRATWDTDESYFFVGVCPWNNTGSLYYLQGSVYAARLYEKPITPDQVKLNYDMTLKYRDSFKNE